MIRFIAAIDAQRGMANDKGIPWQGKVPSDLRFFREKTVHSIVLMGYGTYVEFAQPLSDRKNYVATTKEEQLRPGFDPVNDARAFLSASTEDVWVIGGPGLFAGTIDMADELCITQLKSSYGCTKFFPEFAEKFELTSEGKPITENDITYTFQVWKPKK